MGFCTKGLKKEFETAVVNELSVSKPLKFYCILILYLQNFYVFNFQVRAELRPLQGVMLYHSFYLYVGGDGS